MRAAGLQYRDGSFTVPFNVASAVHSPHAIWANGRFQTGTYICVPTVRLRPMSLPGRFSTLHDCNALLQEWTEHRSRGGNRGL